MCYYNRTMKFLLVFCVWLLNHCAGIATPPSSFFVFGRDVPLEFQYNNPHKNYDSSQGKKNIYRLNRFFQICGSIFEYLYNF